MLIYRCDKCGKEHRASGIVKNLWKQHGYEQLSVSIPGITDVCATCYGEIKAAWMAADRNHTEEKQSRFLRILGIEKRTATAAKGPRQ